MPRSAADRDAAYYPAFLDLVRKRVIVVGGGSVATDKVRGLLPCRPRPLVVVAPWATRSNIRKIELDHDHGGIVKINPLADWTEDEVWDYIRGNDVPYHPLYDSGYQTIGCSPCTRPVEPGQNARSGRWWWEGAGAPKECGMHCAVETGGFEHELEVLVGNDRR